MNSRSLIFGVLLPFALGSCGGPDRAPHPTAAVLDLKQKKGWLGISLKLKKRRTYLVVKAIDGSAARDPKLPEGVALPPGTHAITLSARRDNAIVLGRQFGGSIGAQIGQQMDAQASSRHDRTLTVRVLPGHDYVAHMRSRGDSYEYWIEDETEGEIVADTRL
jgi:hypothetical protein